VRPKSARWRRVGAVATALNIEGVDREVVRQAKVDLAAAFRAAALHGFNEGIDNHLSLAVPEHDDLFLINRYGPHWSEITADDIITLDLEGNRVEGEGEVERTAFAIHRGVHQARPSARAVFHTHMPYAAAVSCLPGGFETRMSQSAMYFHGHVGRVSFGGIASAAEEGHRLGEAVGDSVTLLLMDSHGVMVVGTDVADAWHKLYFAERAAQVQILAQSAGQEPILVSEKTARETASQWEKFAPYYAPRLFDAVKRQLDRENPGYDRSAV
jgi:ribulose-5-phosphate 4-epimerase/fuculose-1-phosphate aldolase